MGGDGGSFSTRADMVKTKGFKFLRNLGGMGYVPNTQVRESDERLNRSEARDLQLSTCALSQEPLRRPVVACRLGRLYNKEELLAKLLAKALPPHMNHISSLKDVKECNAEINKETRFLVCPVSGVDIRSGIKASVIWSCGCVVSSKALQAAAAGAAKNRECASSACNVPGKSTREGSSVATGDSSLAEKEEAQADDSSRPVCLNCGQPYDAVEDLVPLSPSEEELDKLKEKVLKIAQERAAQKKAKKHKAASDNGTTVLDGNHAKKSPSAPKTAIHPVIVAPCATSTKLRADSFSAGGQAVASERKNKKRARDWVIDGSSSVDALLSQTSSPPGRSIGRGTSAAVV